MRQAVIRATGDELHDTVAGAVIGMSFPTIRKYVALEFLADILYPGKHVIRKSKILSLERMPRKSEAGFVAYAVAHFSSWGATCFQINAKHGADVLIFGHTLRRLWQVEFKVREAKCGLKAPYYCDVYLALIPAKSDEWKREEIAESVFLWDDIVTAAKVLFGE